MSATTDVQELEKSLVFRRTFNAPRELVFQMFSTEHIANWWGPQPWRAVSSAFDFRVGGEWRYAMVGPNGEADGSSVVATFREIAAPERIVMDDVFIDKDGNRISPEYWSTKTIELFEREGATELVLRSEYKDVEALKSVLAVGMVEGTTIALDQLTNQVEQA